MTLSAMVYLALVGLVGAAGAVLGEAGLRRLGLPSRWSWLAGMALGPVGGLGLHGFLGDALYWRAELSAIGAGAAIVLGGVSVGWVFGS